MLLIRNAGFLLNWSVRGVDGGYRGPVSDVGILLSRSCTTGWLDWVHGELWLTRTALIRSRLSLRETRAHGTSATVYGPVDAVPLPDQLSPEQVRCGHRTNRYISLSEVSRARLRRGLVNDRLNVTLRGGGRFTFLWLRADPGYAVLGESLPNLLGDRFSLDRVPES